VVGYNRRMTSKNSIQSKIAELVYLSCEYKPEDPRPEMIVQMIETCLKMAKEGHDSGQIKLVTYALKEIRYAYQIFNRYVGTRKVSIYGSARTPEDSPDYKAAVEFGKLMAESNWMHNVGA